jgi:two-component system cell cycle sensor histidine kinase/response regulator CckA
MERTLLRHFPNGILILVDHDLRYTIVDGLELARTGRSAEELEGKTIWENYPPEVARYIEPFHRRALAGESVSYEAELHGKTYFVQGEPVYEDGKVVAAVFATQETSELRDKFGMLEEEQRALFDHLPDTVISVFDRELRLVQTSSRLSSAGWTRDEVVGKTLHEILDSRPEAITPFEVALAGESSSYDYIGVQGRLYWMQVVPLMRGETIFGVMSIAQDITERKRLERELEEQRHADSLNVLAGGVAHDFNNLLQAVVGHTALAIAELPVDSPVRLRLEAVQSSAAEATELANKMLQFSGRKGLELADVDLSALVRSAFAALDPTVRSASSIVSKLGDDLPAVRADAGQLLHVPVSLIDNAIEAGGAVTVSTGVEGVFVYLEVADDGHGMDEDTRGRMFEPFFTTRFTGRGLGLAAVQGIVRGHGGSISVVSTPGVGTTVRVLLPAAA